MSKFFAGFLLLLSVFMLLLNLTGRETGKPYVLILWLIIGAISVYKLCQKPTRPA
jgi:hypothetical protein